MTMDIDFEWRAYALCFDIAHLAGSEENPFFVEGRGGTYPLARKFCVKCPVVVDCLIEGMREDNVGFWGCTSPSDRTMIRRKMVRGNTFKRAVQTTWANYAEGVQVPDNQVWNEWKT